MKISDAFPSRYLKAGDLRGRDVVVQINYLEYQDVSGDTTDPEERLIVYFAGKKKGFVLNRTNANTITAMYGEETDRWTGKFITIWETETEYRGKMVPCLRVRVAPPRQQATAPDPVTAPLTPEPEPEPAPAQTGDPTYDIPF